MLTYFSGSLLEVFNDTSLESSIIVPITDNGIIQDPSIRHLAMQYPEILSNVLTYCSGRSDGLVSYYLNNELNSQLIFISCITTKNGLCEILTDTYIALLDLIISGMSQTLRVPPTTYIVEPRVNGLNIFDSTIEEIMGISTKYGVGVNYVIPSLIL